MKKVCRKCGFFLLLIVCTQGILAAALGDVNASGVVDIVDALMVAQYYVGLGPDGFDPSAADVDGSGASDIVDALMIAQYYVGLLDQFPGAVSQGNYAFPGYGTVPDGSAPLAWEDNPALSPIGINPYGTPQVTRTSGYLLLSEGPNGFSQVPESTQLSILTRINEDLEWLTGYSHLHMPPWATGETERKYIDYFFTNTGLPNDPGSSGFQGWEGSYPYVATDSNGMSTSNRYNLTHEFIHVLQNSYGTVPGNRVSWVHESYNDYLIIRLCQWRNGGTPGQSSQFSLPSNIGYLDSCVYDQPYVPIESCGINSSGEATGPGDYMNDSTGYRYNDLFPLFIDQRVGPHFYPAVWEYANTSETNLQTMQRLLDETRLKQIVYEYAARLALGDFKEFSSSIQSRATTGMYAATSNQNGWLVPSDASKLPRCTGRNNIPLSVAAGAASLSVNFQPDATGSRGTPAEMRCQLAYRATEGSCVFSTPVASGATTINLDKAPRNNVVIAVISNVTLDGYTNAQSYGWDPTERFGYQLQVTGGSAASINQKYF